jgi:O-acetyl-ADP-ribose deacetylase (regulator of RNase III)
MRIELLYGDITELNVDCIINAARPSLLGGGGVDGAIHRKAGIELKEECAKLNGCETGEIKITSGFNLKSKYIIHAVGPRMNPLEETITENDTFLLGSCYQKSLEMAREMKFLDIAFPNISTGSYGFPKEMAAQISLEIVSKFLIDNDFPKRVIFCCYDIENLKHYIKLIEDKI